MGCGRGLSKIVGGGRFAPHTVGDGRLDLKTGGRWEVETPPPHIFAETNSGPQYIQQLPTQVNVKQFGSRDVVTLYHQLS